jgi:hypothetical protein
MFHEVDMKTRGFSTALTTAVFAVVAVAAFSAAGIGTAAAEPCTGPFRECAIGAGATCSRDRDGVQRMSYWDFLGNVMGFEQCVGRVFEAAGQPNPYKSTAARAAASGGGRLSIPRTELLYPHLDP